MLENKNEDSEDEGVDFENIDNIMNETSLESHIAETDAPHQQNDSVESRKRPKCTLVPWTVQQKHLQTVFQRTYEKKY